MVKICQVIIEHKTSYPYSVEFRTGEEVTASNKREDGWIWCTNKEEKGAWVPEKYLSLANNKGTILSNYISTELTVEIGEKLRFIKEESGWIFCTNKKGQSGWIPIHKVRSLF